MKLTKKSVAGTVGAAALLASVGLGLSSVAQAAPVTSTKPPVAAPAVASVSANTADAETADSAKDTDTLQQGDQTTPDTGTSAEAAAGTESTTESAAGTETASETGPSDGNDGGHADAPGADVNHEGGANEK